MKYIYQILLLTLCFGSLEARYRRHAEHTSGSSSRQLTVKNKSPRIEKMLKQDMQRKKLAVVAAYTDEHISRKFGERINSKAIFSAVSKIFGTAVACWVIVPALAFVYIALVVPAAIVCAFSFVAGKYTAFALSAIVLIAFTEGIRWFGYKLLSKNKRRSQHHMRHAHTHLSNEQETPNIANTQTTTTV